MFRTNKSGEDNGNTIWSLTLCSVVFIDWLRIVTNTFKVYNKQNKGLEVIGLGIF